ncbi:MAG: cyclic nucleotide-binding domain-containing protein [Comamonadaceae bacterium]|nr:cyclic nucleotide-binding domain-containing protein [Comamonadaceae bacterium]
MVSHFADLQPDVEPLGTVRDFVNEFIEAVASGTLLQGFSRQETVLLSEYLQCFGVPRQSTILREGDEGDFLAILITGQAVVTKQHDGVDKVVYTVKPGDMIGEMSLIDGQKRFASCITTEPSDFAVLTADNFSAMLADHPRLANKLLLRLLNMTTARLRHATNRMLPGLIDFGFF